MIIQKNFIATVIKNTFHLSKLFENQNKKFLLHLQSGNLLSKIEGDSFSQDTRNL